MSQPPPEYDAPNRGEHVETTNQDYDYPTDTDRAPDFPAPDWDENNPIPVYIVERPKIPQLTDWSSERFTVTDNAVQIAGSRRNRTRIVVKNEGTDAVFIDPHSSVTSAFSYRLAANEELEMLHNGAVWARCDSGDTATVSVEQEYEVALTGHE